MCWAQDLSALHISALSWRNRKNGNRSCPPGQPSGHVHSLALRAGIDVRMDQERFVRPGAGRQADIVNGTPRNHVEFVSRHATTNFDPPSNPARNASEWDPLAKVFPGGPMSSC